MRLNLSNIIPVSMDYWKPFHYDAYPIYLCSCSPEWGVCTCTGVCARMKTFTKGLAPHRCFLIFCRHSCSEGTGEAKVFHLFPLAPREVPPPQTLEFYFRINTKKLQHFILCTDLLKKSNLRCQNIFSTYFEYLKFLYYYKQNFVPHR